MKKNLIIVSTSIFILVLCVYFVFTLAPHFFQNIGFKVGLNKIPVATDFVLENQQNTKIKLSDLRGKNVVLFFWTSWNTVAVDQLGALADYYASYSPKNLEILAINSQEDLDVVNKVLNDKNITLDTLLDIEGIVGDAYSISVLPMFVFIDGSGLKREVIVGPLVLKDLEDKIKALGR
ncbi:MAG: Thiol:disulfide oxidoreductase related to ResA [Parcubacteria bacterium C7867-005]|nr:MAG: Thiol:disulfide oxidoreductase related to ResA [Parcubacteria bacterium C7867-005]